MSLITATTDYNERTSQPRGLTTLARRLLCMMRGHVWWIDVNPNRQTDTRCCSRCGTRQLID